MPVLRAAAVVTPDAVVAPGEVVVDDGVVVEVRTARGVVPDRTLVPAFVDLQVNGFDDVDVAAATPAGLAHLAAVLAAHGTGTWLPTVVSRPLADYAPIITAVEQAQESTAAGPVAGIAGVHLEGPFLGGAPGAHDPTVFVAADMAWLAALPAAVRVVTLAPEVPGGLDAVRTLTARGVVVAVGHSTASYETTRDAVDAGARVATHCFNGMGPLHHRRPGVVGAVLTDDRIAVSVIADLVHVHAAAVALVFRAKGRDRTVLVSDAVAWRHDGAPARGGDGAVRRVDGTLAGAGCLLDTAVRNAVRHAGVALPDAIHAAATAPAALLGLDDVGRLARGARADIVALDPDLRVTDVWLRGEPVR